MSPLIAATLFWAVVFAISALFGILCIKYGVYTSGHADHASLEI